MANTKRMKILPPVTSTGTSFGEETNERTSVAAANFRKRR